MSVPKIENYTEQWDTNPSTTLIFNKPSGVQVGDLLLIIAVNDDTSTDAFDDTSKPSGWNFIIDSGNGASDSHVGLFWKIATGGEGSSETVTSLGSDEWGGWYVRISGIDTSNPINVVGTPHDTNNVISQTAYAVTTDVDDCLALCFGAFDGGDGFPFTVAGTNWYEEDDGQSGSTGANDCSGVWGYKEMTGIQGSTGIATIGASETDGMTAVQIAIAPVSGDVSVPINQQVIKSVPISVTAIGGALIAVSLLSINAVPNSVTVSAGATIPVSQSVVNVIPYSVSILTDQYVAINQIAAKVVPYSATIVGNALIPVNRLIVESVPYAVDVVIGITAPVNLQVIDVIPYSISVITGASIPINQLIVKAVPYSVAVLTDQYVSISQLVVDAIPYSVTVITGIMVPVGQAVINVIPFSVTVPVGENVFVPVSQQVIKIIPYQAIAIQSRRRVSENGLNLTVTGSGKYSLKITGSKNEVEVSNG